MYKTSAARKSPAFNRIAFIVDQRNWAYDNVASHIKPLIERDYAISIDILYIEDFDDDRRFVLHLLTRQYDLVHFFWRKYPDQILTHCISINATNDFERVFCQTAVSFSVASAEGSVTLNANGFSSESRCFHLVDGYCTISKRLHETLGNQVLLPRPISVLHDRTDLIVDLVEQPRRLSRKTSDDPLTVIWAGNSGWGSWLGMDDAKGVRILRSAVEQARNVGCAIDYIEFDAQKQQVPQEQIGAAMLAADVYVCASLVEGTPLPVVEAMAAGCAVITTDVGIVREHLPYEQHELIVARETSAFADALQRCARDTVWTAKIGVANREAIRAWCSRPIHDEWMQFFSEVFEIGGRRREVKRNIIRSSAPSVGSARLNSLRKLVRKSPAARALAGKVYPLAFPILRRLDGGNQQSSRLRRLQDLRRTLLSRGDVDPVTTLAVHCPMWLGLTASTRAMFDNTMPIPFSPQQHPDLVTLSEVDEYVAILKAIAPRRLVISGGNRVHRDIAVKLKSSCPKTRIDLMWHGNQLRWTETRERDEFLMWVGEYRAGTIDKIWVAKRGLDALLRAGGIEAELFENFHPQQNRHPRHLNGDGPIKIGVWSVDNNWQKNLISQLLAFAGDRNFEVYHAVTDPIVLSLLETFNVRNVRVGDSPIPRDRFLSWLGKMDVNLYVTLSECSPNVPLESIALSVPVIVGPTTTFFNTEPFLYERLVVPSPEDMASIRSTVDGVLADYDAVADAIIQLGLKRDGLFDKMRRQLNTAARTSP